MNTQQKNVEKKTNYCTLNMLGYENKNKNHYQDRKYVRTTFNTYFETINIERDTTAA